MSSLQEREGGLEYSSTTFYNINDYSTTKEFIGWFKSAARKACAFCVN